MASLRVGAADLQTVLNRLQADGVTIPAVL